MAKEGEEDNDIEPSVASSTEYTPLPTDEGEGGTPEYLRARIVALSASDKWRLVKPLIPKYMFPLCECPTLCIRTRLLTLTPPQVCVYLVGRHLGKSLSNLLTNLFSSSSIQSTRFVSFFCLFSELVPESSRVSLRLCCIRSHPKGNTPSSPC